MPKGVPNKRYTPEFKKLVIETMQEEKLSYSCINRSESSICTDFQRHLAGEIATPRRNAATTC